MTGGKVGKYDIFVVHSEDGTSKINKNLYIEYKITLTSIYPTYGSVYGGNSLTLNGENFSEDNLENDVFLVKDKIRIPCRVK